MKTVSRTASENNLNIVLEEIKSISPNFICTFFASNRDGFEGELQEIQKNFSDVPVVGCSTAGEISNDKLVENSISILAINFEKTELNYVQEKTSSDVNSYDAAYKIGQKLNREDLKGVLILAPGLAINGSDVARGFSDAVEDDVVIFGGLAGDGVDFEKTHTFFNGEIDSQMIVAVGFYGDSVEIKTGSKGGWSPFGPSRRVTKAVENVLYELDGKPALDLYKEYLQEKAQDLPASGLLYPFAILDEDHAQIGLIRTILDVDHEEKTLTLAGNMAEGSLVCLMHADVDELIEGAAEAASEATSDNDGDSAAFLVSCVGRKLVLTDDVDEEIYVVKEALGPRASMGGFYSYGEISPFSVTKKTELHNQTMTVAHITEV